MDCYANQFVCTDRNFSDKIALVTSIGVRLENIIKALPLLRPFIKAPALNEIANHLY